MSGGIRQAGILLRQALYVLHQQKENAIFASWIADKQPETV